MSNLTIVLPEVLTIYEVSKVAAKWQLMLSDDTTAVAIDLSELLEVDAAGFQLVVALAQCCTEKPLSVIGVDEHHSPCALWLLNTLVASNCAQRR
ncbi:MULTISPECIES: STAS domain-containing protein [Pseudoalteromonas]|uniref:STAS domain-containing protein n=2 Tax=Pseudoalteromonas TaxID=53246 RepID=A0A8I2KP97_9GAMM|nr:MULTISPECIES: STAS domain-containing protein [Pseudoalteromonas]KID34858.1 hypothetical protein QT15_17345 [Pseudoalteromonas flavipulchra NCIMB 2033 = ATCC BAA-314]KJY89160.1 hypothetical protein TW75_10835 [Pseudoalteromonas piscicida]MBD0784080.1 STAS domain-containing protein [Pseudoalteromonas flavipulchra]MBE0372906.1 hypothetical protein [Pseudoalteromonas flavipulchra NCIMB 2033 = ATCC BAA-314]MDP4487162.1 STAS domain-containing protein [Pseudoalteromonas piscicida]